MNHIWNSKSWQVNTFGTNILLNEQVIFQNFNLKYSKCSRCLSLNFCFASDSEDEQSSYSFVRSEEMQMKIPTKENKKEKDRHGKHLAASISCMVSQITETVLRLIRFFFRNWLVSSRWNEWEHILVFFLHFIYYTIRCTSHFTAKALTIFCSQI